MSDTVSPFAVDNEIFDAYLRIEDFSRKFGVNLGNTRFAVIGFQSVGKTTLICALAGEALGGAVLASVGTRCPTTYILKRSSSGRTCVRVGGTEVPVTAVFDRVTAHQQALREFSGEELIVEVEGPRCVNMTFTDLMGLRAEGRTENEQITPILRRFLVDESVSPIFVVAAQHDPETIRNDIESLLKRVGVAKSAVSSRALLLVGRLDEKIGSIDGLRHLQSIVEETEALNLGTPQFFSCNPASFSGRATALSIPSDPRERSQFFHDLAAVEGRALDDYLARLGGGDRMPVSPELRRRFGLLNVMKSIQSRWVQSFRSTVVGIQQQVGNELDMSNEDLKRCRMLLHNKSTLRDDATRYINQYHCLLRSVYNGDLSMYTSSMRKSHGLQVSKSHDRLFESRPATNRRTLKKLQRDWKAEETEMMEKHRDLLRQWFRCDSERSAFIRSQMLEQDAEFCKTVLAARLKEQLFGGAAVFRALRVWGYMFMKTPFVPLTAEDVIQLNGCGSNNKVIGMDVMKVIRLAVRSRTDSDVNGITVLTTWIHMLFHKFPSEAEELLSGEFSQGPLAGIPELTQYLREEAFRIYTERLKSALEAVSEQFVASFADALTFLEPHMIYAELALIMSTQLYAGESVQHLTAEPQAEDDNDDEEVEESGDGTDAAETQPSAQGAIPTATADAESSSPGIVRRLSRIRQSVKDAFGGDSTTPRISLHQDANPLAILEQQLKLMADIGRFYRGTVSTALFCTLPEQKIPQVVEGHVEDKLDEINKAVQMFRTMIKGKLLMRLHHIVQQEFLDPFAEMLNVSLLSELQSAITKLSDVELQEKAILDPDQLRDEINRALQRTEGARDLSRQLEVVARKLGVQRASSHRPPVPFDDEAVLRAQLEAFRAETMRLQQERDEEVRREKEKDDVRAELLKKETENQALRRKIESLEMRLATPPVAADGVVVEEATDKAATAVPEQQTRQRPAAAPKKARPAPKTVTEADDW